MFDIAQQQELAKQEDGGTDVHLNTVEGKPAFQDDAETKPVFIRVAGENSERYRRVLQAQQRRRLKGSSLTPERMQEDLDERIAASVIAWEGLRVGETVIECTPANVRMVLKACPWVRDQLTEAMSDPTRFFSKGSPTQ